ncbi:MAG: hypothetical protein WCH34_03150 [Bacteroidota bacterium]
MISLDRFILLTLAERLQYVFNHGVVMFNKLDMQHTIKLYLVDNLFVEVWFHVAKNKIEKVVALNEEQVLIHYGELIDISSIFD